MKKRAEESRKSPDAKRVRPHTTLQRLAEGAITWSGSSGAFILALSLVLVWIAVGPLFGFSDSWQLVINTGTTIVTFLMVFLIQRAQNKDSIALHLKLNELIAAKEGASNRLLEAQNLSEEELETLERHYLTLADLCRKDSDIRRSHSVEEAEERHSTKRKYERGSAPRDAGKSQ